MAKVEPVKELQIKPVTTFKDMEVGDIAIILNYGYKGEYVLRCNCSQVIRLSNSGVWTNLSGVTLEVRILDKGEQIILTQER